MKRLMLCLLFALPPQAGFAAVQWLPVKDVSMVIEPGSILDFSALLPQRKAVEARIIVNQNGRFALQSNPAQPQRFLMASVGFGVATGSYPSHAMTDLYVQQLRMHGYNMVRLDFVEDTLMSQRRDDFDFDPEQLDRYQYLLAALKQEGIYYVLNGFSAGNAGYGNIKERWNDKHQAKLRVYYDEEVQTHWKKLIEHLLASTNPYTKMSTLADPALAGVILVNEGGLAFVTRKGVPEELRILFSDWLKNKYGSAAALGAAWKDEIKAPESMEQKAIDFPMPDAWAGRRMSDAQQFFLDREKKTADWMAQHLRGLGYKGLLTAYDNWLSPAAHLSRGQFEWVDLHNYFADPVGFTAPGSKMRQDSMLAGGAKYIAELAGGRHIGKAFTTSEYGQVFWNKYRRESALAVPAYASFQGWDMISQHAGAIILSYAEPGGRKDRIFPFMIGPDPVTRANETLAALLFLRGDVAPAKHMLGVKLTPDFVFNQNAFLSNLPADITRLALVTGIGLDWQGQLEATGKYDAQIEPGNSNLKLAGKVLNVASAGDQGLAGKFDAFARKYAGKLAPKISKVSLVVEERFSGRIEQLRIGGLLDANNLTNTVKGLYQTDTGQMVLDSQRKRLTVVTPNTEALVFDSIEPVALNNLKLEQADGPALVSVSSMDGRPLLDSKRMLVVLATDARNSGMQFYDSAETTIQEFGRGPVLIRTATVKLMLKNRNAAQLKVYSNTLRGKRGDPIPVKQVGDTISFTLDTSRLSHGPTTYFEIVGLE